MSGNDKKIFDGRFGKCVKISIPLVIDVPLEDLDEEDANLPEKQFNRRVFKVFGELERIELGEEVLNQIDKAKILFNE